MNKLKELLKKIESCKTDIDIKPLIHSFKELSESERYNAENPVIRLFENDKIDEVPRSWMPTLLGLIKTEKAYKYLIDRLPIERNDLFRRWISAVLVRYYSGDERIYSIMQQIENEKTSSNRLYMLNILIESKSVLTSKTFIKYLNEENSEYSVKFRQVSAKGLSQLSNPDACEPLINRLALEKEESVVLLIIDALSSVQDERSKMAILKLLQSDQNTRSIYLSTLHSLTKLCSKDDSLSIEKILQLVCSKDKIVAFAATDALLNILSTSEAVRLVIEFGLKQDSQQAIQSIGDSLRVIGSNETVELLTKITNDPLKEQRAHDMLIQLGGNKAIGVLVSRRLEALSKSRNRVEDFDAQALSIFDSTITQAKKGFTISLWMSGIIFSIGVGLLITSIYFMVQPNSSFIQQLFGLGGAITGIGSILAMFYNGPVERIEHSVANLVQTEIAFLGFIRQITQVTAMFEREYLDNDKFNINELQILLSYTERCVKETMPLVNKYTAKENIPPLKEDVN